MSLLHKRKEPGNEVVFCSAECQRGDSPAGAQWNFVFLCVNFSRETNSSPLIDFGENNGNETSSTQEMDERISRQFGGMGTSIFMTRF